MSYATAAGEPTRPIVATGRTDPPEQLPRTLSTLGGLALAVSNVGPTISIGVGLGILAGAVGAQMPIVFILAFLPMLGIAVSYAFLNREEPSCGTAYVWLRRAISPWVGYLVGWVGIAGNVIFLSYAAPLAGQITLALAQALGLPGANPESGPQATLVGVGWLALTTVLAVRGTDVAVRAQLLLVGLEVLVVGTLCATALAVGDAAPVQAAWFDPTQITSGTALASGLVLAVYVFWGWDSAFSVTEETTTPAQASRAGLLTLVAVLVMFVLSAVAFQRALTPGELAEHGALGLPYLGEKLFGAPGALAATLALLMSAVAVLQSVVIAGARVTLAMSRDRTLGPVWARLHPRYGTPAIGTLLLGGISVLLTLLSAFLGPLQTVIVGVVTAIGLLVSLSYGLAGGAAAWRFRGLLRTDPLRGLLAVVFPALSALALVIIGGLLAITQLQSTDHLELDATNGWFLTALPAAIVMIGLVLAAWTKYHRRAPYFERDAVLGTDLAVAETTDLTVAHSEGRTR